MRHLLFFPASKKQIGISSVTTCRDVCFFLPDDWLEYKPQVKFCIVNSCEFQAPIILDSVRLEGFSTNLAASSLLETWEKVFL